MTPYKLMKWGLIVPLVLLPLVLREEGQWWQHLVLVVGGYGDGAGQPVHVRAGGDCHPPHVLLLPTTEVEALELAEGFMRAYGLEPGPEHGITALALKQVLEAKGIPTKGFRVEPQALQDYFAHGKHFVVAVGIPPLLAS